MCGEGLAVDDDIGEGEAVDSALSGDGEAITMVSVDYRREVVDGAPLHAGGHRGEVADFVGPQEDGAVEKVQVGARFEEEGSGAEASLRNHDDPASGRCRRVDGGLDDRGIQGGAVADGPEGGDAELRSQGRQLHCGCVVEPGRDFRSVGPEGGILYPFADAKF